MCSHGLCVKAPKVQICPKHLSMIIACNFSPKSCLCVVVWICHQYLTSLAKQSNFLNKEK